MSFVWPKLMFARAASKLPNNLISKSPSNPSPLRISVKSNPRRSANRRKFSTDNRNSKRNRNENVERQTTNQMPRFHRPFFRRNLSAVRKKGIRNGERGVTFLNFDFGLTMDSGF